MAYKQVAVARKACTKQVRFNMMWGEHMGCGGHTRLAGPTSCVLFIRCLVWWPRKVAEQPKSWQRDLAVCWHHPCLVANGALRQMHATQRGVFGRMERSVRTRVKGCTQPVGHGAARHGLAQRASCPEAGSTTEGEHAVRAKYGPTPTHRRCWPGRCYRLAPSSALTHEPWSQRTR